MHTVARAAFVGVLAAVGLTLAGCGGGKGVTPTATLEPRAARISPIDTVGLARIRFARGTTSRILDDSLAAGATRSYVLAARQGQVMLAHAIAWPVAERLHPPPEPEVRVYDPADGRELPSPRGEPEVWSARSNTQLNE